ncbi:dTDP-4-dehydrorhamnose reductase [Bacillus sp. GBSW2]|uniref:dTDP-4-dehydrorhamnose reductase n=1 Tax=Bacillus sp. GBSW2 TaxID=2108541 RepID=UPI000D03A05D|nr:dTDP-4-dehydrorhamnose reductase [Bacillus sp. GBSW2]PRS79211.1 dTDP-4-dehydrorhamnose reductase [Bacillus sp. GBSW2]
MKVLITGAGGQLGKELSRQLKEKDITVIALTRSMLNIADQQAVRHAMRHFQPDIVVSAAAYTSVDQCETETEKAYLVNGIGAYYTALEAKNVGADVLHVSTDYVFDGQADSPYQVDAQADPQTIYGKSKKLGEELIHLVSDEVKIIRTSWLYGHEGHNFVNTILRLAETKDHLRIVNDQVGSPTYTKDVAEAIIHLFDQKAGIYHVSNRDSCSWFDFASEIVAKSGLSTTIEPISTEEYGFQTSRPAYSVLDLQAIEATGWQPRHWKDALHEYLQKEGRWHQHD